MLPEKIKISLIILYNNQEFQVYVSATISDSSAMKFFDTFTNVLLKNW
jgi:hypothetical protein